MAVGTVSAADPNQYQLISTQSATSGTSITFNSLSGYKTYLLTVEHIYGASAMTLRVRFNSDSTAGKYTGAWISSGAEAASDTSIIIANGYSNARNSGYLYIYDALLSSPKRVEGAVTMGDSSCAFIQGIWFDTSAITSITVSSSSTFSSGNIKLYGIAG